jgi:hypothetical protein
MAWWSRVGDEIEKHDGPQPKLGAMIRLNFSAATGTPIERLGLYKQDPVKRPDAENLLPGEIAKVQQKKIGDGRKRRAREA